MRTNARKLQVIALAALFVVPVAVAWFMYAGQPGAGGGQGAHGLLADPPIELGDIKLPEGGDAGMEAQLTGRWTFLYLQRGECGPACENALIRMRQVRLALGKDANRVQRLLVAPVAGSGNDKLAQAFPGMAILPPDTRGRSDLIERVGSRQPGEIVLVDPLGNLVLSYPPGLDPDGLFRDAKHLLRLSKIG